MQGKFLTVLLDEQTIEVLRELAAQRGLIVKRGPGAERKQGSISKLLRQMVDEYRDRQHS